MTTPREQLAEAFKDKDFRDRFVREFISTGLPYQIRATRRARGWTQRELGERIEGGMAQEYVSRLEDPDVRPSVNTAERVAAAFDCALVFRLIPFSRLLDWSVNLTQDDLVVPTFVDDMGFQPARTLDQFPFPPTSSTEAERIDTANVSYIADFRPRQSNTEVPYEETEAR